MATAEELKSLTKPKLIERVCELQSENESLKKQNEQINAALESINQRLIDIERNFNLSSQYNRRSCIEISGIPVNISGDKLEEEVIKIYASAGYKVQDRELAHHEIQSCHRIGKKGKTICRMVNRKFAEVALYNSKKLKDSKVYENKIFINNSFCKDFNHFNYIIRKANKARKIHRFKIQQGVHHNQVTENGEFIEIAHQTDLTNLGITLETITL